MTTRMHATLLDFASEDGVERNGPGTAPTAARIWKAGENMADDGPVFFTQDSASRLLAEQGARKRLYSIDFDHLSLERGAREAMAGRASGYHRLEVRDGETGPELWAVDIEWTKDVKAGLEETPPLWRYFSPAFVTDDSGEVTSYINLALCINPMTHGAPMLAAAALERKHAMDPLAEIDKLIAATNDPAAKAALQKAREALAGETAEDKAKGDTPPPAKPPPPPATSAQSAAAEAPAAVATTEKPAADVAVTVEKHAHSNDAITTLSAQVVEQRTELAALKRELARRDELAEIEALLAPHKMLPDEFRAHCLTKSVADVKAMLGVTLKLHAGRKEHATRGETAPGGDGLPPGVADEMDRRMGVGSSAAPAPFKTEDGRFVMHTMTPSELRRAAAEKGTGR